MKTPHLTRWALILLVPLVLIITRLAAPSPILRTTALGTAPWQIVLDQRTARAFVITADDNTNAVSVLDTTSGALIRTTLLGGTLWLSDVAIQFEGAPIAGVDEQTQRVFIAYQNLQLQGIVSVLDAQSGALLGTIVLGTRLRQTGAVAVDERTQRVFVADQGMDAHGIVRGMVSVLDARSGLLLRTVVVKVDPDPTSITIDTQSQRVFVTGSQGNVAILDARTGAIRRTVTLRASAAASLADEQTARLFISDAGRGTVTLLDTHSGRRLRTVALPHGVGAMALDERANLLFVTGSTQGSITALDARSGAVLRTVAVGLHPIAMAVNRLRGQVLVGDVGPLTSVGDVTAEGSVGVLTEGALALQRTLPVGVAPADLAVDERSGHVLVVNSNYNPMVCGPADVPVAEDGWMSGLRWLKRHLPWLPVALPPSPPPLTHGSVTLLDSARL